MLTTAAICAVSMLSASPIQNEVIFVSDDDLIALATYPISALGHVQIVENRLILIPEDECHQRWEEFIRCKLRSPFPELECEEPDC